MCEGLPGEEDLVTEAAVGLLSKPETNMAKLNRMIAALAVVALGVAVASELDVASAAADNTPANSASEQAMTVAMQGYPIPVSSPALCGDCRFFLPLR